MSVIKLKHDPYNLIITGVGGQGNVLSSRMLGSIFTQKGYYITIGETFGASQRGGSVMSHVRISRRSAWSPQIPRGKAHLVIALEPSEAIRVLSVYGNPKTRLIWNTRPIYPVSVISGAKKYPGPAQVRKVMAQLTAQNWSLNATEKAMDLGGAIFANIIMMGALSKLDLLPFSREDFSEVLTSTLPSDKVSVNLDAFDSAAELLKAPNNN